MGQYADMVFNALKAVQELKIITVVGKVTVGNALGDGKPTVSIADEQQAMVTSINLVQGDITNGIDPAFTPGQNDALRQFHERQVSLGNEIINRNVTLLKDAATEIIDIIKKEKDAGVG